MAVSLKVECPYCSGESGSKDYFGEWSECPCCDPPGADNETGRVWIWRLLKYRFELWKLDRWIERHTMHEDELKRELERRYGRGRH